MLRPIIRILYEICDGLNPSSLKNNRLFHSVYLFCLRHFAFRWWRLTEGFETQVVKNVVKPGQIAVDIGANIGYFTTLLAEAVGPTGQVFAFEPDPLNFSLLKENVDKRGFKNVTLVQKAVAEKSGEILLYRSFNPGDHRIYQTGKKRETIAVELITLDQFFAQTLMPIHFLKIDVQGAELAVLQGMKQLFQNSQQTKDLIIFAEFSPFALDECGFKPEAFLQFLTAQGYAYQQMNSKMKKIEALDSKLLKKENYALTTYVNLLCRRYASPNFT